MMDETKYLAFPQSLSEIQLIARDLYERKLNVFPVPKPFEVTASGRDPLSKPPYIAEPLYFSRMHVCDEECRIREDKTGVPCLTPDMTFEALFENANIAVMTGSTSENLVDIDCDSLKSFETVTEGLYRRSLPYWAFSTHRGGGVMLRLLEGEASNKPNSNIEDVQIWGHEHYVILPPSIHPAGTLYSWNTADPYLELPSGQTVPEVSAIDLKWIGVELLQKRKSTWRGIDLKGLPACASYLSQNNREILVSHHQEGTRNTELSKPTYDIAAHIGLGNISFAEGENVLKEAAANSNYPRFEIYRMLQSAIRKNPVPARKSEAYAPRIWQKAQMFAQTFDWREAFDRMALTTRAAFDACIERSRMDHSEIFRATEREVEEIANFGTHQRAGRAIRLLLAKGLIRKKRRESGRAHLYSFGQCVEQISPDSSDTIISIIVSTNGITTDLRKEVEQDVFIKLGQVSHRVWRHLLLTPERSLREIARAINLSPSSVKYAMKTHLIPKGLVIYSSAEGLYLAEQKGNVEMSEIALRLGTFGYSERRRHKNTNEREKYVNMRLAYARHQWKIRCMRSQATPDDAPQIPSKKTP